MVEEDKELRARAVRLRRLVLLIDARGLLVLVDHRCSSEARSVGEEV